MEVTTGIYILSGIKGEDLGDKLGDLELYRLRRTVQMHH